MLLLYSLITTILICLTCTRQEVTNDKYLRFKTTVIRCLHLFTLSYLFRISETYLTSQSNEMIFHALKLNGLLSLRQVLQMSPVITSEVY